MTEESLIAVRAEMPILLEDGRGRRVPLDATPVGTYMQIPADLYRRNVWMGLFRRWLVRARGYGREYWLDENWRRQNEWRKAVGLSHVDSRGVVVPSRLPKPAGRKCGGCGGTKA